MLQTRNISEEIITYNSTGVILGHYWGGGKGSYSAKPLSADTEKELIKQAEKGLKDGSLDNGMGFESLVGAYLNIQKITTIIIDEKEFVNTEYSNVFVGKLSEDEENFLIESNFY